MTATLPPSELARLRKMVGFTPGDPSVDPFSGKPKRGPRVRAAVREHQVKMKRRSTPPVAPSAPYFSGPNTERSLESARRDVRAAEQAVASDIVFSETQIEILLARIEYPYDSIAELGERIGRSKNSVAGALREVRRKVSHLE